MAGVARRAILSVLLVLGAIWPAVAIAEAYPVWANHVQMEAGDFTYYLETPEFTYLVLVNGIAAVGALVLAVLTWWRPRAALVATAFGAGAFLCLWFVSNAQYAVFEWLFGLLGYPLFKLTPGWPPPVALPLLLVSAWGLAVRRPGDDPRARKRRFALLALLATECAVAASAGYLALLDYQWNADTETPAGDLSSIWPEALAFAVAVLLLIGVARRVRGSYYVVTVPAALLSLADLMYAVMQLPSGGANAAIGTFLLGVLPWGIASGLLVIPTFAVGVSLLAEASAAPAQVRV